MGKNKASKAGTELRQPYFDEEKFFVVAEGFSDSYRIAYVLHPEYEDLVVSVLRRTQEIFRYDDGEWELVDTFSGMTPDDLPTKVQKAARHYCAAKSKFLPRFKAAAV